MEQHDLPTAETGTPPDPLGSLPEAPGYRILSAIAEGGFGEVFLAEQFEPVKRRVALKFIKPGMDSRAIIARFEAERQALALMDHPCVAKVLDAGMTSQGRPYFAMEYVQGEPITEFCDRHRLPIRVRLDLFIHVCHAVQHAHQRGLIHRDLKPSNILVRYEGEAPAPKVIDFGVAKALSQKLTDSTLFTEQGQLIGTPEYMSPEQAEMSAVDIDTRTDVYSLGVLLYELLTGALPFDSSALRAVGFSEVQRIIRETPPSRPSQRTSAMRRSDEDAVARAASNRRTDDKSLERILRGDLDWITLKCLEKERSRRYESASSLAADLQRFLDDEPITARPPSTTYKLRKFARRNRSGVAAAVVVTLAIVSGIVIAIAGSVQAQREAERAAQAENRSRLLRHLIRGNQVSLAVLPLANASDDASRDYIVDGITSDLIGDLSSIRALRLISDDSVMRYKGSDLPISEVANELRVDGLVTGVVDLEGDDLRIEIEFTHALSDEELFSASYEGSYRLRSQLQSRIAIDIAERLGLGIAPEERARLTQGAAFDPRATDLLARGRHTIRGSQTEENVMRALDLIDQAIEIEPNYPAAHVARANAFIALGNFYRAPLETMPQAKDAALRALELDPLDPDAHVMLGIVEFRFEYEYETAAMEFRRALDLNPSSALAHFAYGQYLAADGRFDEALERYERALAIDPLAFLEIQDWFYSVPFNCRDFDKAIEYAGVAISVEPEEWWSAHAWMGLCYTMTGEYERALEHLQDASALSDDPMIFIFRGCTYAAMGDDDRAWEMIAEIERQRATKYICPFEIATVYIALGEYDIAFDLLDQALDSRSPCGPWFGTEPRLDPIRDDPRFPPLLERSGRIHGRSTSS